MIAYYWHRIFVHLYTLCVRGRFCRWGCGALIEPMATHLHLASQIEVDEQTTIGSGARLTCWGNGRIRIGKRCCLGEQNHITAMTTITLGDDILTGSNVLVSDNAHGDFSVDSLNQPPLQRKLVSKGPIRIGDRVWIGQNVCILGGVSIGEGAVIGANSVVTQDVPSYTMVAGVPARIYKQIGND